MGLAPRCGADASTRNPRAAWNSNPGLDRHRRRMPVRTCSLYAPRGNIAWLSRITQFDGRVCGAFEGLVRHFPAPVPGCCRSVGKRNWEVGPSDECDRCVPTISLCPDLPKPATVLAAVNDKPAGRPQEGPSLTAAARGGRASLRSGRKNACGAVETKEWDREEGQETACVPSGDSRTEGWCRSNKRMGLSDTAPRALHRVRERRRPILSATITVMKKISFRSILLGPSCCMRPIRSPDLKPICYRSDRPSLWANLTMETTRKPSRIAIKKYG